jgi:superfamily II DNA or RNA helicase
MLTQSQTTYKLRKYQTELIQKILDSWQSNRSVMLQLPTGGGKTVLFAHLARKFAEKGWVYWYWRTEKSYCYKRKKS